MSPVDDPMLYVRAAMLGGNTIQLVNRAREASAYPDRFTDEKKKIIDDHFEVIGALLRRVRNWSVVCVGGFLAFVGSIVDFVHAMAIFNRRTLHAVPR